MCLKITAIPYFFQDGAPFESFEVSMLDLQFGLSDIVMPYYLNLCMGGIVFLELKVWAD